MEDKNAKIGHWKIIYIIWNIPLTPESSII